ncbi:MAG: DNA mismatch repair protein MutS [Oligoflexia bacterium]|nr:DNA mismatch repair protein MutS [Oligoflexia bacterium]
MKQYWDIKAKAGDALLLFRMGDFYELFGDDAVEAAKLLEITLTSRDRNKPNPMPMAGVPHHSVQSYIQRLLKAGKKVAIGEQMEDPASVSGKAIVRRDLTRIFTPGVQFDAEGSEAHFLATLTHAGAQTGDDRWVLACLDASTGEALVSEPTPAAILAQESARFPIRHLITLESQALPAELNLAGPDLLTEKLPANFISLPQAEEILKRHYGLAELSAFIPTEAALLALGLLVRYATRSQQMEKLAHLRLPSPLTQPRSLQVSPTTARHLDLLPSADGTPSLYQLIQRARSSLGARQLKRWLLSPLSKPAEIAERQQAVREIHEKGGPIRERLGTVLAEVYDIERILGRVSTQLANPRDTLQLGRSLSALPGIASMLGGFESKPLQALCADFQKAAGELGPLGEQICRTQREDAPMTARDGGIFNRGTSADLDRLIDLTENGQRWLVDLEARERAQTGIGSLKVRYNRVFGYYIEVTQAHAKSVPAHYQRKQTTVGTERFFTEELKNFEEEILTSNSRQKSLEQELFSGLLTQIQAKTTAIMDTAARIAELDALLALSRLADEPGWCFPVIDDSLTLDISAGRHPLVDQRQAGGQSGFVPNDLFLSDSTRLTLLITGPNMGGKSTVMRQNALIVILGQMGAPVPATHAQWGAVSSLYTRIGAHDAIARGQSTFMVEMSELAHILHFADERSFIILDEIGRGTSTYDGMSIAWATLEWICNRIRARTLFATHYHELTRLSDSLPLLANAHMAVARSEQSEIRFLYKLADGPTSDSFGIHVARIAGIPSEVIDRACAVLEDLESKALAASEAAPDRAQLSLFAEKPAAAKPAATKTSAAQLERLKRLEELVKQVRELDPNRMTPLEALNALAAWKSSVAAAEDRQ